MDEQFGPQTPAPELDGPAAGERGQYVDPPALVQRRRQQLVKVLAEEFGDLGVTGLRMIGGGLESVVYRADSVKFGAVAIKLPLMRVLSTGNEPSLDTRELLAQEYRLANLVRPLGVPCPEPLVFHTSDESVDFLMAEHVETDGSEPSLEALGELVGLIHGLDVDPLPLVAMEGEATAENVVLRRLGQRFDRLRSRVPGALRSFDAAEVMAGMAVLEVAPVLLHMDARPANLLAFRGEVRGIVDWSNALFGPAALELARIAESGNLTPAFLAGYGLAADPFEAVGSVREVVYRLDTAVMLAHVFMDNDMPPAVQHRQVARVGHLADALAEGARPDDSFIFQPDQLMKT